MSASALSQPMNQLISHLSITASSVPGELLCAFSKQDMELGTLITEPTLADQPPPYNNWVMSTGREVQETMAQDFRKAMLAGSISFLGSLLQTS